MKIALFLVMGLLVFSFADAETLDDKGLVKGGQKPIFSETINSDNTSFVISGGCCKNCRKGKACGDSCISKKKQCTEPSGCACNAN